VKVTVTALRCHLVSALLVVVGGAHVADGDGLGLAVGLAVGLALAVALALGLVLGSGPAVLSVAWASVLSVAWAIAVPRAMKLQTNATSKNHVTRFMKLLHL
jgi:hypothetical protein